MKPQFPSFCFNSSAGSCKSHLFTVSFLSGLMLFAVYTTYNLHQLGSVFNLEENWRQFFKNFVSNSNTLLSKTEWDQIILTNSRSKSYNLMEERKFQLINDSENNCTLGMQFIV